MVIIDMILNKTLYHKLLVISKILIFKTKYITPFIKELIIKWVAKIAIVLLPTKRSIFDGLKPSNIFRVDTIKKIPAKADIKNKK